MDGPGLMNVNSPKALRVEKVDRPVESQPCTLLVMPAILMPEQYDQGIFNTTYLGENRD
jgi:hypothetical protein